MGGNVLLSFTENKSDAASADKLQNKTLKKKKKQTDDAYLYVNKTRRRFARAYILQSKTVFGKIKMWKERA